MHLNTIFALFTILATPLWALPLQDEGAIAREYVTRDVIPTDTVEERGLFGLAFKGAEMASNLLPRYVRVFFLLDYSSRLTFAD